jgi:hypothetical protein
MDLDLKVGQKGPIDSVRKDLRYRGGFIRRSVLMLDKLALNETAFASLTPEQRLMAAIIRRAVADLPLSRRFFETDNGMFLQCCEALSMNSDEVRAQITIKHKAKQMWMASSASAV